MKRGMTALGRFKSFATGDRVFVMRFSVPDALKIPITKNSAHRVGKIPNTVFIPFFAPSINASNTLTFLRAAHPTVIRMRDGSITFCK